MRYNHSIYNSTRHLNTLSSIPRPSANYRDLLQCHVPDVNTSTWHGVAFQAGYMTGSSTYHAWKTKWTERFGCFSVIAESELNPANIQHVHWHGTWTLEHPPLAARLATWSRHMRLARHLKLISIVEIWQVTTVSWQTTDMSWPCAVPWYVWFLSRLISIWVSIHWAMQFGDQCKSQTQAFVRANTFDIEFR